MPLAVGDATLELCLPIELGVRVRWHCESRVKSISTTGCVCKPEALLEKPAR